MAAVPLSDPVFLDTLLKTVQSSPWRGWPAKTWQIDTYDYFNGVLTLYLVGYEHGGFNGGFRDFKVFDCLFGELVASAPDRADSRDDEGRTWRDRAPLL